MFIKGTKKFGLIALLASMPAVAVAQDTISIANNQLALEDSIIKKRTRKLDPVVVKDSISHKRGYIAASTRSATKTNTLLRDIPQSITIVTKQLIKDQSMQSMADAVRYVPGITMGQGEGNRDQPTIRGNNTTADFYVNGVRDDVQYFRDLYNSERIEALKGSNAMVFGRGGAGGVINRVTKEAQWNPIRELTFEGGSHTHRRTSVDIGQGVTEKIAARINGMYENSGLYRNAVDLERYGINPTVTLAAGVQTTVKVGYEFFKDYRTADRGIPSFLGSTLR